MSMLTSICLSGQLSLHYCDVHIFYCLYIPSPVDCFNYSSIYTFIWPSINWRVLPSVYTCVNLYIRVSDHPLINSLIHMPVTLIIPLSDNKPINEFSHQLLCHFILSYVCHSLANSTRSLSIFPCTHLSNRPTICLATLLIVCHPVIHPLVQNLSTCSIKGTS